MPAAPYASTREQILAEYRVGDPAAGLDPAEAERRLGEHGPNRLREARTQSAWKILAEQFKSLIVLILFIAGVLSILFEEPAQGIAIFAAVLINAGIGFFTEIRAIRSMEALRRLDKATARVRRGGELREIAAEDIVPGDVVAIEAGDLVPADLRLIETSNL